jgi:hypothetical protein
VGRHGLGRCSLHWGIVHACPSSHQFWDYPAVSSAFLKTGGTMKRKYLGALLLLGCVFVPPLQAQIRHIEMRVEGMT